MIAWNENFLTSTACFDLNYGLGNLFAKSTLIYYLISCLIISYHFISFNHSVHGRLEIKGASSDESVSYTAATSAIGRPFSGPRLLRRTGSLFVHRAAWNCSHSSARFSGTRTHRTFRVDSTSLNSDTSEVIRVIFFLVVIHVAFPLELSPKTSLSMITFVRKKNASHRFYVRLCFSVSKTTRNWSVMTSYVSILITSKSVYASPPRTWLESTP